MSDYFLERKKNSYRRLQSAIADLPAFCADYFIGIEQNTAILTRLHYAFDLRIFFEFLYNEISEFKGLNKKDFTLNDLNRVSPTHLEYFLNYLNYYSHNEKDYSNNEKAKARKLSAVKTLFNYFYKKEKITQNITQKVSAPKIHDSEIVRLEIDEVVKLLNLAEFGKNLTKGQLKFHGATKIRDVALLTLFLGTGIRISECVGLNVDDIDFSNNSFKVTRKGGNKTILYFSSEVSNALKEYISYRDSIKDLKPGENALFLSLQNKRLTVRAVQNLVKKYAQIAAPLKKITPHKLRSTYGTALYQETKDIYIVADVLGHKDVNTTKKHYAAISDEIRRNAANAVKLRDFDDK